jgi:NhaP-type Na+/H+ or K+/H+ antiporter
MTKPKSKPKAATRSTDFRWSEFAPSIVLALAGSLVAGYLFARISMLVTRRITDAPSSIIVQFAGTFTVWIVADRIGLSGILTIVAYAITVARTAPAHTPARLRVPILRRVGNRRLCPQRAGVCADRPATGADLGPAR